MFLLQIYDSKDQAIDLNPPPYVEQILETKHHLSYNALKGANGLGTLKFQGQIVRTQNQDRTYKVYYRKNVRNKG